MNIALLGMFLITGTTYAQTGTLNGWIRNKTNDYPLDSVLIVILSGTFADSTVTDSSGYFRIKPVPCGKSVVRVTRSGYQSQITEDVIIGCDKTTYFDLRLTPAAPGSKEKRKKVKLNRAE